MKIHFSLGIPSASWKAGCSRWTAARVARSCPAGAFRYHSIGYKPRESATVLSRRSESGLIGGAHSAFQCASAALSSGAKEIDFGPPPIRKIGSRRSDQFGNARHHYSESGCQQRGAQVLAHPFD